MSKKIGLLCSVELGGKFYAPNQKYIEFCQLFGDVYAVYPNDLDTRDYDLLVLPGGADVLSTRYNEFPDTNAGYPNLVYEYFDKYVLPKYIDANIPIFGICRAMQSIAVHFGAKLNQHVKLPTSTGGKWTASSNRGRIVEHLSFVEEYKGLSNFNSGINSLHHQEVNVEDLPETIKPIAFSKEHGSLEIYKIKDKPIIGVQFHPEELRNKKLYKFLIKSLMSKKDVVSKGAATPTLQEN